MDAPHPPPADVIGRTLVHVADDFKALIDAPVWSLDDGRLDERLEQALAVRAAADELVARIAGEMHDRGHAPRHGARSVHAHLVGRHRLSAGEAKKITAAVQQLHGSGPRSAVTEPVRRAQACGEVTAEQAMTIATAINRLGPKHPIDAVHAAQADLLRYAGELPYGDLQRLANHVVEVLDPERADELMEAKLEADERGHYGSVELAIQMRPDGGSNGRFTNLPALQTAMLKKALDALGAPRRDHLYAPEAEVLDRRTETSPDELPYANRLGRAFCELIEHLPADALPARGATSATLIVTVEESRLRRGVGEAGLDTGTSVSVSEARRLACNAGLLAMVLDGEGRVLDLGRTQRLFDRHQRLVLAHRDRGCVFPRCDRPAAWCEAHHVTSWQDGGRTDVDNGVLLCSFHHHLVHRGDWQITIASDGVAEAVPPPWFIDRTPLRHARFRPRPG